jgi:hypothetical protein
MMALQKAHKIKIADNAVHRAPIPMNTKTAVTLIAACIFVPIFAHADSEPAFPKVETEYRFIYASPQPRGSQAAKPGDFLDTDIRLKILKVQPDGWVLASRVFYTRPPSEGSPATPTAKVAGKLKELSPASWYNLRAFSQAIEQKKEEP